MAEGNEGSPERPAPITAVISPNLVGVAISQQDFVVLDEQGTSAPFWVRMEIAGPPLIEPEEAYKVLTETLSKEIKAAIIKHKETLEPPIFHQQQEDW
jgi:hypothetical protein